MKFNLLVIFAFVTNYCFAQMDSVKRITVSAYGEFYYSYDFANPQNHNKPDFIYNHKRHNEISANLILAKASYNYKNVRANLGLMTGNYAQYNLSTEPTWAQFIYEANVGIKLTRSKNIWLDAGIIPSHIGFESALSADCFTLTRSMVAENSPYYESGVKLTYISESEKISIAALILNGWQRIQQPDYIQRPSFGAQVTYKPLQKFTLNYSNFVGSVKPDSVNAWRHYHNVYLQYDLTKSTSIIAGYDIGFDKYDLSNYGNWYSPIVIIRQGITNKTRVTLRAEYYSDPKQIVITTGTANGFQTWSVSTNVDFDINENVRWRVEGKLFESKDIVFSDGNQNYSVTTNVTFRL